MKKIIITILLPILSIQTNVYGFGDSSSSSYSSSSVVVNGEDKTVLKNKYIQIGDTVLDCGYIANLTSITSSHTKIMILRDDGIYQRVFAYKITLVTKYRTFDIIAAKSIGYN